MYEGLRVLLIEDDPAVRFASKQALELAGLAVEAHRTAEAAIDGLHAYFPGILVADIKLPGMDGMALLQAARRIDPALPVIMVTGHGDVTLAVQAMRAGAYDFLEKPTGADMLVRTVLRALETRRLMFEVQDLRRKLEQKQGIEGRLLGDSAAMVALRRDILSIADAAPDVLIEGETGAGKEVVARALHEASPSRSHPFVGINCGAIPESMFESELFGHERGAFTGAQALHIGKIEYAAKGTLFLDEVESMPMALQIKLLRVLQSRQVERLGSNIPITVNFRVIAATKTDLKALSDAQKFRSDLYFRLNVMTLGIPPLRERREDIPMLFEHLVLEAATRYKRPAPFVTEALLQDLIAHDWPGNVRELGNIAARLVLGVLGPRFSPQGSAIGRDRALKDVLGDVERSMITDALRRGGGDVVAAAEALGVPKKTLYDKMRRYGLAGEEFRSA